MGHVSISLNRMGLDKMEDTKAECLDCSLYGVRQWELTWCCDDTMSCSLAITRQYSLSFNPSLY